jgi:NTP pyrophosphatase (non-canonical NTP hydrolase)
MEECGEVIEAIGKILRHGYESCDPTKPYACTNRSKLEQELGDVRAAMLLICASGDVKKDYIHLYAEDKLKNIGKWLHHQPKGLFDLP